MHGLLADINVQGHVDYLGRLIISMGLMDVLQELGLSFYQFRDFGLARDMDDRFLWHFCQLQGLVLFTDNRNHDGPNSLGATLADSWKYGNLPILTLANRGRFANSPRYAELVAKEVAELLFGIVYGDHCDQSRIFVPRSAAEE